jgi:hypothetical protein
MHLTNIESISTLASEGLSCQHCNYDLTGLKLSSNCPECGDPIIMNCFRCEYELVGVDPEGPCPECGYPIQDSIGHGSIARCSASHLATLHKGVFLIQAAVIAWILNIFTGAILGGYFGASGQALPQAVNIGLTVVLGFIGTIFVIGWWKFTSTDPGFSPSSNHASAQRFVRVMLITTAAFMILNVASNALPQSFYNSAIGAIAAFGFLLAALAVWLTFLIAQMLYTKSFAPMILNKKVYKRSKYMLWLGPLLSTVGILIIIGPLIALVLYWNMLDWIRKDLKTIRAVQ